MSWYIEFIIDTFLFLVGVKRDAGAKIHISIERVYWICLSDPDSATLMNELIFSEQPEVVHIISNIVTAMDEALSNV